MMRVSMTSLLERSLPLLTILEAINSPNTLNFSVEAKWLSRQMYEKAHLLVTQAARCILKAALGAEGGKPTYYVLSLSQNKDGHSLSYSTVSRCELDVRATSGEAHTLGMHAHSHTHGLHLTLRVTTSPKVHAHAHVHVWSCRYKQPVSGPHPLQV